MVYKMTSFEPALNVSKSQFVLWAILKNRWTVHHGELSFTKARLSKSQRCLEKVLTSIYTLHVPVSDYHFGVSPLNYPDPDPDSCRKSTLSFLAHLSRRPSVVVVRHRPHFQTWISLKPVGQSWSNFMCSITGMGERLHKVLGQIGSKL